MSAGRWELGRAGLLVVAVALTAPVSPVLLVCLPLAVQLLAFRRDRPWLLGLAVALLALAFVGVGGAAAQAPSQRPLWLAERAWALLLSGSFVAAAVLGRGRQPLGRELWALAGALAAVAVVGALRPGLLAELDWWVRRELGRGALAAHEWMGGWADRTGISVYQVLDWQRWMWPGLLALASLAALVLGRFLTARLAGEAGLGRFRDLRFNEHLVWVVVAALLLLVVPAGELASRLAENALFFMGGLYLLRGLAVIFWVGAATVATGWGTALSVVAGVLLYPVVLGAALILGLGDTWLDVRRCLVRIVQGPSG